MSRPTFAPTTAPWDLGGGVVTAALGLNLWVLALGVPALRLHSHEMLPLLLPAPLLLGYGIWRSSAAALLLGAPLAALAPLAVPELEGARQQGGAFVVVALALVAYLAATLRHLGRLGGPAAPPVARRMATAAGPLPSRWRRRRRLYLGLSVAALLVPAALLYFIDLHPATVAAVAGSYGHPESAHALLTAIAALVSVLVFALALLRPLAGHLDQDRALAAAIGRRRATAGRPRRWLLLAIGVALGALATSAVLIKSLRGEP